MPACDVAVSMVASAAIVLLVLPAMFSQLVHGWWEEFWVLVATLLCLAAVLWFNHKGRLRWASRLLAITALVSSVLMVHLSGIGIRDTSMLIFPAILVIGALILDAAFFLAFAVSVVSLLGLEVVLQIHHLNPNSYAVHATYSDLALCSLNSLADDLLRRPPRRDAPACALDISLAGGPTRGRCPPP